MIYFCISFLLLIGKLNSSNIHPNSVLDDDVHFLFKWPGTLTSGPEQQNIEFVDLLTSNNERYKCSVPIDLTENELTENKLTNSQNQATIETSNLIKDNINSRKFCSYRIESYWIYELCHGQYVKQYHETKAAGKRVVTQEYFLGYFDPSKQEPDYFKQSDGSLIPNVHWKTLKGERVAMFAVKYADGTTCEVLNGVRREITVYYACDDLGNDNIAGFEEISSCIYEMIVVTKWICSHPAYKIPDKKPKEISCFSANENYPTKPIELSKLEKEQYSLLNERNEIKMTNQKGETFIIHYNKIEDEEGTFSAHSIEQDTSSSYNTNSFDQFNQQASTPYTPNQQEQQYQQYIPPQPQINDEAQKQMIQAFLSGSQCLTGGSGWWKYEICFGKDVNQFHEDEKSRKRHNIHLGRWIVPKHLEWLSKNPNKKPAKEKSERVSFSVLYSDGEYCTETNKNRQVEVKFRCVKNKSHAISLYLLEPSTCEYLLAVESPWLCDLVQSVDENGLINTQDQGSTSEKNMDNKKEDEKLQRHLDP